MSSRPKVKSSRPQRQHPSAVARPEAASHKRQAQLACFVLGRYSRQLPQSQEEADEFSAALSVWVQLGTSLYAKLQPVRQTFLDVIEEAKKRRENPPTPPSGLLGADGLPIEQAPAKLWV